MSEEKSMASDNEPVQDCGTPGCEGHHLITKWSTDEAMAEFVAATLDEVPGGERFGAIEEPVPSVQNYGNRPSANGALVWAAHGLTYFQSAAAMVLSDDPIAQAYGREALKRALHSTLPDSGIVTQIASVLLEVSDRSGEDLADITVALVSEADLDPDDLAEALDLNEPPSAGRADPSLN